MKIKIDQEKCIGCGSCTSVCPDVFDLNDENKAILKDARTSQGEIDDQCVKEAVDICPVQAIEIEE
jgi:ferredoxin